MLQMVPDDFLRMESEVLKVEPEGSENGASKFCKWCPISFDITAKFFFEMFYRPFKSGAPSRAQNLRALGPRTLRKPQNTVATLHRVGSALCMQKKPE